MPGNGAFLLQFFQLEGSGLVDVVVDPVGVEKVGVRFPGDENVRRRVIVAEIVLRHIRVQTLREVALVLFFQRVGVVFAVTEYKNLPAVDGLSI